MFVKVEASYACCSLLLCCCHSVLLLQLLLWLAAADCVAAVWDRSGGTAVNSAAVGVAGLPLLLVLSLVFLYVRLFFAVPPAPLSDTAQRVSEVDFGVSLPQTQRNNNGKTVHLI